MTAKPRAVPWMTWLWLAVALAALIAWTLWYYQFCCRLVSRGLEWIEDLRGYGYPIKEAPGYGDYGSRRDIYWLDNDRVLFGGHTEEDFRRRFTPYRTERTYSLLIWNVRTNDLQKVDDTVGGDCYFDGYLTYDTQITDAEVVSKEGPLNQLTVVRRPRQSGWPKGEGPDYFGCGTYRYADLGVQANCLAPLVNGDGFIDATGGACRPEIAQPLRKLRQSEEPSTERTMAINRIESELRERPVLYYRAPDATPVPLPIKSKEASFRSARYAAWSRQYVVIASVPKEGPVLGYWPDGLPRPIYLISAGGVVDRVDIPWTKEHRGKLVRALPTHRGIVVISNVIATFEDPGDAGLYLLKDSALVRMVRGLITNVAVAPDGCKVAFGIEKTRPRQFTKLAVIDVCKGSAQ